MHFAYPQNTFTPKQAKPGTNFKLILTIRMSTEDQSPRDILATAIATNSIPGIQHGLDLFAQSRRGLGDNTLEWLLNLAVKSSKRDVVKYLVDVAGARVEMVRAQTVGIASREEEGESGERDGKEGGVEKVIQVLEVLVQRGWDVNKYIHFLLHALLIHSIRKLTLFLNLTDLITVCH